MKRTLMVMFAGLMVLAILGLGALGVTMLAPGAATAAPMPAVQSAAPLAVAPAQAGNPAFSEMQTALEQIYTQVSPSVVTIVSTQTVTQPVSPFSFGRSRNAQPLKQQALGSGFVWDAQGDIVTNNHVIAGADSISVMFADGSSVPGKVVGADPDSDLAVVKVSVPAAKLHPVQPVDSSQLKVGQVAIAIGNPYGEQNTMTTGIISALGRSLPVDPTASQGSTYTIPDAIQTDAPINPGNSGGVLLNDQGQVIGVTSQIESASGASAGIGFAIPSNIVQLVVPSLISNGHFDHPYLGIEGTSLDPAFAKAMNLDSGQHGALIIQVAPGSPAAKAGLLGSTTAATIDGQQALVGGDVITAINGVPVNTFDDLSTYLAIKTKVGQSLSVTILRNGKTETVQVTLQARPGTQPAASALPGSSSVLQGAVAQ